MPKPIVLSLFTGAGGLDYGFEAAGFDIGAAVECERDSCKTLRRHGLRTVIERDVFEVPTDEILASAGVRAGEADILIAGPPCQPFSKSGYWARGDTGRLADPRAQTLDAFLRVAEEALPRVLLLENVAGLSYHAKNEGLALLLDEIAEINRRTGADYEPVYRMLNAADYGVPQFRHRFFLVAARDGRRFCFPRPTHGEAEEGQPLLGLEPFRNAWDALGDLGRAEGDEDLKVRGKWAGLLKSIPEGENYLWHTDRGGGMPLFGWRRRYWSFLLKLAKRLPSWTIQAQPGPAIGPFHWENRELSVRELCRLQTFPDSVEVVGNRSSAQHQIGNAVPSLLGEVLAREIRAQLLPGRRLTVAEPRLVPPVRQPVPPAEPVERVPPEYHQYKGEHTPHPGTGQGDGAATRGKQARAPSSPW